MHASPRWKKSLVLRNNNRKIWQTAQLLLAPSVRRAAPRRGVFTIFFFFSNALFFLAVKQRAISRAPATRSTHKERDRRIIALPRLRVLSPSRVRPVRRYVLRTCDISAVFMLVNYARVRHARPLRVRVRGQELICARVARALQRAVTGKFDRRLRVPRSITDGFTSATVHTTVRRQIYTPTAGKKKRKTSVSYPQWPAATRGLVDSAGTGPTATGGPKTTCRFRRLLFIFFFFYTHYRLQGKVFFIFKTLRTRITASIFIDFDDFRRVFIHTHSFALHFYQHFTI